MFSYLPTSLVHLYVTYALSPYLTPMIPVSDNSMSYLLSAHPEAFAMLLEHPEWIDWDTLSINPGEDVVTYLLDHPEQIYTRNAILNKNTRLVLGLFDRSTLFSRSEQYLLCKINDPDVVRYLLDHPHLISWSTFCQNQSEPVVELLLDWMKKSVSTDMTKWITTYYTRKNLNEPSEEFRTNLHWPSLNRNPHPSIVSFLMAHPYRINIYELQANPCAVAVDYIIQQNLDRYQPDWQTNPGAISFLLSHPEHRRPAFCSNADDRVVDYYLEHPEEIDRYHWCKNKNPRVVQYAIEKFQLQPDDIDYSVLELNPSILTRSVRVHAVEEWNSFICSKSV